MVILLESQPNTTGGVDGQPYKPSLPAMGYHAKFGTSSCQTV